MKTKHFFLTMSFALVCVSSNASLSASDNDSLCGKGGCTWSGQAQSAVEATKHLNKAIELAREIKDPEVRETVLSQLNFSLDCLKKEFLDKNYENVTDEAVTLYENLGEILAECNDAELKGKIYYCISDMMETLKQEL